MKLVNLPDISNIDTEINLVDFDLSDSLFYVKNLSTTIDDSFNLVLSTAKLESNITQFDILFPSNSSIEKLFLSKNGSLIEYPFHINNRHKSINTDVKQVRQSFTVSNHNFIYNVFSITKKYLNQASS